ncbi:VOC family protein [Chryseobacterium paridis]|uniref:VOC family protein n=1 Tax=Chryseobacterium paridis TaxID=2800328 RepID=A0ABS1FZB0_9FLAO|nr:VOC family protein [Chryseobacterium paridis]MBK1897791.1 VOC family protein [Chryseobacterium paridis]
MSISNPVVYFEIPVNNIERAEKFYTSVFHFSFEKEIIDHYEMSIFPFEEKNSGITGALAKGDVYKPTKDGVIIYFTTADIDLTLEKVLENGGKVLYPKTFNEKYGCAVAEFEDSEGNRIALHQTLKNRE